MNLIRLRMFFYIYICILPLIMPACSSNKSNLKTGLETIQITIGSGGGAAGTWNGYMINGDRTIYKWSGKVQGDNPRELSRMNKEKLNSIWDTIVDSDCMNITYHSPGNFSNSLQIKYEGKDYFWVWESSSSESDAVKLQGLYEKIKAEIEK